MYMTRVAGMVLTGSTWEEVARQRIICTDPNAGIYDDAQEKYIAMLILTGEVKRVVFELHDPESGKFQIRRADTRFWYNYNQGMLHIKDMEHLDPQTLIKKPLAILDWSNETESKNCKHNHVQANRDNPNLVNSIKEK